MNVIQFVKKDPRAVTPTKAGPEEVGWDLTVIDINKKISDKTTLYDTGIAVKPPKGYYTELIPRSSLSKTGHMLANSVGVIDATYRGNLLIPLTCVDDSFKDSLTVPFTKIQLVLRKFEESKMEEVQQLDETTRGEGGFGSTDSVCKLHAIGC